MRAYKCDRCGAFTTGVLFTRKPRRFMYKFGKKSHLCAKCCDSFYEWLSSPEKDEIDCVAPEEEIRNDE